MDSRVIVDFGSSAVVTFVGKDGYNGSLNVTGIGDVSYAGFQEGEFLEPENLKYAIASSISNASAMSDQAITEVYIGVPGEFSSVVCEKIDLNFPKLKKITDFDVKNIFDSGRKFDDDEYRAINQSVVYYEIDDSDKVIRPIGLRAKKLSGNISYVLAKIKFINIMKAIFAELKIEIKGFISSVLAENLYLFNETVRDKYVLLVDVGYITTTVSIARGNGLLFLNSFSLGGAYIAADLSTCLNISFSEAERLKNHIILAWKPDEKDLYFVEGNEEMKTYNASLTNDIACERTKMICDYIKKCFNNCSYDLPKFLPIYLTGGGLCTMGGVRSFVGKCLERQVVRAKTKNLQSKKEYNSSEEGLLFVVLKYADMLDSLIIKV